MAKKNMKKMEKVKVEEKILTTKDLPELKAEVKEELTHSSEDWVIEVGEGQIKRCSCGAILAELKKNEYKCPECCKGWSFM